MPAYILHRSTGRIIGEFLNAQDADDALEAIDYACPRMGDMLDVYEMGDNGWQLADTLPSSVSYAVMRRQESVAA